MDCWLVSKILKNTKGFTLVEVLVVLILLTLSFMVFLRALNTGKNVRANSEIRTVQAVLLNSIENEIRARKFDENSSSPWSSVIGKDSGESLVSQFDDIDDFHDYNVSSITEYPGFSYSVEVKYVSLEDGEFNLNPDPVVQTDFKCVTVTVSHAARPSITDMMIISSGL
ncbi:MAG: hypothetical protein CMG55_00250 [Candidatus Marinimicrobia bacterium]|nr:hypothetical protein [Candidatus Neomarinimicrobiota bacterium]